MKPTLRVAAVQTAPAHMDRAKTIVHITERAIDAGRHGADLVVFPECIVPMYPSRKWLTDANAHLDPLWTDYRDRLLEESVDIPGQACASLAEAAMAAGAFLVVGVNERVRSSTGWTLYNAALLFSPEGRLKGHHRKTTPVFHERLYHTQGQLRDVSVTRTKIGTIGLGICFENLHPLYRYALIRKGEEIHCALWVSLEEDKHLVRIAAQHHAAEGGVVVVAAGQVGSETEAEGDRFFVGGSCVIAPGGRLVAEATAGKEETLIADLASHQVRDARRHFDILGRDARCDLYRFNLANEV